MTLTDVPVTDRAAPRIESLLSSRLFIAPQLAGDRLFFISNLGGALSLYAMDRAGSVPEPLLPPGIALQNPELVGGYPFRVFPDLKQVVVMIDRDGDENYQPMVVPIDGGFPQLAFGEHLARYRCHLSDYKEPGALYIVAESRDEPLVALFQADLRTGEVLKLDEDRWLESAVASEDCSRIAIIDGYTAGDNILYLWEQGKAGRRKLYGTTLEEQPDRSQVPPNGIHSPQFTPGGKGLLLLTSLFADTYSPGYLDLHNQGELQPVDIVGAVHRGAGEMTGIEHLHDDHYLVGYNIDGVSWLYEGTFDRGRLRIQLERVLVGEGHLANGTLEHADFDERTGSYALAFSTATTPTQLYTLDGANRTLNQVTRERILGIPEELLSPGEDASFESFDGLRISSRLYLPAAATGHVPPYPLVYYIHGGPQSQEGPNFAWFSMPLIQFLTLNGFAVFVPNVRGSTGYGQRYMKLVDHDWGGDDRLDHVYAMSEILRKDSRIDIERTGVMGRSYGGYMTLTLASRHPELWTAAVDMFGPQNLVTFMDRIPETWKPYFKIAVGDPETERDFLLERSPSTYLEQVRCPLLVIQGRNDPRVVEQESRDVVERLQAAGKEVDFLVFENEGHDVLKYENKVVCYTTITEFFKRHLAAL